MSKSFQLMELQFIILSVTLLITNIITVLALYKNKKVKSKERSESIETREFVADLLNGEAILKITRVNPTDVFLRSPRANR